MMRKTLIATAVCSLFATGAAYATDVSAPEQDSTNVPYCTSHNCDYSVSLSGNNLVLRSEDAPYGGPKIITLKDFAENYPQIASAIKQNITKVQNDPNNQGVDDSRLKVKLDWQGRDNSKDDPTGKFVFDLSPVTGEAQDLPFKTLEIPAMADGSNYTFDVTKGDNGPKLQKNEKLSTEPTKSIKHLLDKQAKENQGSVVTDSSGKPVNQPAAQTSPAPTTSGPETTQEPPAPPAAGGQSEPDTQNDDSNHQGIEQTPAGSGTSSSGSKQPEKVQPSTNTDSGSPATPTVTQPEQQTPAENHEQKEPNPVQSDSGVTGSTNDQNKNQEEGKEPETTPTPAAPQVTTPPKKEGSGEESGSKESTVKPGTTSQAEPPSQSDDPNAGSHEQSHDQQAGQTGQSQPQSSDSNPPKKDESKTPSKTEPVKETTNQNPEVSQPVPAPVVIPAETQAIISSGVQTALLWSAEMNDVNKRLGDLHFKSGEYGAWARTYGGEYKTKFYLGGADRKVTTNFYAVQVGYDQSINNQLLAGLALSYMNVKGKMTEGSAKSNTLALTAYGTYSLTDDDYIDLVGKIGRITSKIDNQKPHTWAYALSAEYGHRFNLTDNFFVTPNAEVTFGHMGKMTFSKEESKSEQAAINTIATRIGANVGYTYSTGSVAMSLSYKHEFNNKVKFREGKTEHLNIDLGGSKLILGLKGTQQLNDKLYIYYGAEKSFLSKTKLEWHADFGVRYNF